MLIRKILELRILKAIVDLSRDGQVGHIHFVNDSSFKALNNVEREKFTRIFFEYPEFKERYAEPRAAVHDLQVLSRLPENTFGYQYVKFIKDHKYSIDWFPYMEETSPLHFARTRQYQTHDALHTITGFSGSRMDELGLQGFYAGQGAPNPTSMCTFTAATLNLLQSYDTQQVSEFMDSITEGYLMGKNAKRVIFRKWEDDWNTDIDELRSQLGIVAHKKHAI